MPQAVPQQIPTAMRAVQFDRYGSSAVLELRTVPVPAPGPEEVLVRVHASGLNPKDPLVRAGGMRLLTGRTMPRGTGFDVAGEVVSLGARVSGVALHERVRGLRDGFLGGAAADHVAVPREWLASMPAEQVREAHDVVASRAYARRRQPGNR